MKKNFLLLLLLTLLPLAGWAATEPTDLSKGWSIQLSKLLDTYTGDNLLSDVTVSLVHNEKPAITSGFNVVWKNENGEVVTEAVNVGWYEATVTSDMTNTYGDLANPTMKFWVLKANAAITTAPALAPTKTYDGEDYTLVTNVAAAAASFGTIEYVESETTPAANAAWSTASPVASAAGVHHVWYRVVGTDNFNGIDPKEIGTVTIEGQTPTFTAPEPKSGLLYDTKAHELITAGTATGGTMQYSLDGTNWSTSTPTGTNAGAYTVYYKVVGDKSHKDIAPANFGVSIAKGTPKITAPAGATDLTFNGQNQNILTTAATATLGATVVYDVAYKAPGAADYDPAEETTEANMSFKNAGDYQITAKVKENDNLNAVTATDDDIKVVTIAKKAAVAPTAIEGLVYNKKAQSLINAGEAGIVKYSTDNTNWVTEAAQIANIKGVNAGSYKVYYKVDDPNYKAVPSTQIANVKIAKAFLTIVVKDREKTYDAGYTLPALGTNNYEVICQVDEPDYVLTGMDYAATDKKNAGGYENELGVVVPDAAANNNYEINVVKGKLTINKAKLTVTASQPLIYNMTEDVATSIKYAYSVDGVQGGEAVNVVWSTRPVLTSNAPTPLVPGHYTLSFTKGTLKSANYEMKTEAGDGGYVIPDNAELNVTAAAGTKVVITVVGHSKTYGEKDPDYTKWVAGTDYYVSGLAAGDAIKTIEFSRAEGENVGKYDLNAVATVNHPEWYAGGIVYNNAKLTINAKELVATVGTQYVTVGTTPEALPDADAWSVTGLASDDTKEDLVGKLSIPAGAFAAIGEYDITLAITNTNYTLKAGSEIGKLIVIASDALALDDEQADNFEKIVASNGKTLYVTMALHRTQELPAGKERNWTKGRWNSLILPFDVTVAELSDAFGYAIFNVVDGDKSTANSTQFKLEMGIDGAIPANTPFLIKTNADMPDGTVINFGNKKIVAPAAAKVEKPIGSTGNKFIGTYETVTISAANPGYFWYGASDSPAHIGTSSANTWDVVPFACYVDQNELNQGAHEMSFIYEDLNGNTTAIRSISADEIDKAKAYGEGWYNLNGVKMQGVPTEKGIYILNGKKVVLK